MSWNQFPDEGADPAAPAKLSPNTVVQPAGGGGTGSASAAGAAASVVTVTPVRHPAVHASAGGALRSSRGRRPAFASFIPNASWFLIRWEPRPAYG